jgi:hypothetical protein
VSWKPDAASEWMERLMEEQDVPEKDRDEVRRFAELLRFRKARKDAKAAGAPIPSWPSELWAYMMGGPVGADGGQS